MATIAIIRLLPSILMIIALATHGASAALRQEPPHVASNVQQATSVYLPDDEPTERDPSVRFRIAPSPGYTFGALVTLDDEAVAAISTG